MTSFWRYNDVNITSCFSWFSVGLKTTVDVDRTHFHPYKEDEAVSVTTGSVLDHPDCHFIEGVIHVLHHLIFLNTRSQCFPAGRYHDNTTTWRKNDVKPLCWRDTCNGVILESCMVKFCSFQYSGSLKPRVVSASVAVCLAAKQYIPSCRKLSSRWASLQHDGIMAWKRFAHYWPFVMGNHWWC